MRELTEEEIDLVSRGVGASAPPALRRFAFPLSADVRTRIEHDRREALRLYGLANPWLASALLGAARQAQASSPHLKPDECTYEARLIWGIVPELARRLGVVKLTTDEIDWHVRDLSDYDLRLRAGYTLRNIAYSTQPGWRELSRDIGNGNMVIYAVDRLCPGRLDDRDDPIVRNLVELAACRERPYNGVWTPAMNLPVEPLDVGGEILVALANDPADEGLVLDADEESEADAQRPGA
ncbi:hypothetical protein ACWV27_26270 (plasmid) [Massilia varians]